MVGFEEIATSGIALLAMTLHNTYRYLFEYLRTQKVVVTIQSHGYLFEYLRTQKVVITIQSRGYLFEYPQTPESSSYHAILRVSF